MYTGILANHPYLQRYEISEAEFLCESDMLRIKHETYRAEAGFIVIIITHGEGVLIHQEKFVLRKLLLIMVIVAMNNEHCL